MSDFELLVETLKANPGHIYITADGTKIFMIVGPEQNLMYVQAVNKNFNDMTEDEINAMIQNLIR